MGATTKQIAARTSETIALLEEEFVCVKEFLELSLLVNAVL